MPLIIGKAVAMIFNDKPEVVDAYMEMAKQYGGQISAEDMAALTDLTQQDMPMVTVSGDIAQIQLMYQETLNKI